MSTTIVNVCWPYRSNTTMAQGQKYLRNSKMSYPGTKHNVPGLDSDPDRSIRRLDKRAIRPPRLHKHSHIIMFNRLYARAKEFMSALTVQTIDRAKPGTSTLTLAVQYKVPPNCKIISGENDRSWHIFGFQGDF